MLALFPSLVRYSTFYSSQAVDSASHVGGFQATVTNHHTPTTRGAVGRKNAILIPIPARPGSEVQIFGSAPASLIDDMVMATKRDRNAWTFSMPRRDGSFGLSVLSGLDQESLRGLKTSLGDPDSRQGDILPFYLRHYSGWPVLVCEFDGTGEITYKPVFYRYVPRNPGSLFFPSYNDTFHGSESTPQDRRVRLVMGTMSGGKRPSYRESVPDCLSHVLLPEVLTSPSRSDLGDHDFAIEVPAGASRSFLSRGQSGRVYACSIKNKNGNSVRVPLGGIIS